MRIYKYSPNGMQESFDTTLNDPYGYTRAIDCLEVIDKLANRIEELESEAKELKATISELWELEK